MVRHKVVGGIGCCPPNLLPTLVPPQVGLSLMMVVSTTVVDFLLFHGHQKIHSVSEVPHGRLCLCWLALIFFGVNSVCLIFRPLPLVNFIRTHVSAE